MTEDEIARHVRALHAMADEVGRMLRDMPECLPRMAVTTKPDADGDRLRLLCGIEPIIPAGGEDED